MAPERTFENGCQKRYQQQLPRAGVESYCDHHGIIYLDALCSEGSTK